MLFYHLVKHKKWHDFEGTKVQNHIQIETLCVINISIHLIILTIISKIAPNITIFNRGITAKDFTKKIAITKGEIKSPDKIL